MDLSLDVSQWQTLISQRPGPLEYAGVLYPPVCPDQVSAQVPGADSFLLHHLLHGLHDEILLKGEVCGGHNETQCRYCTILIAAACTLARRA